MLPYLQHQYLVSMDDGGEAMGHYDGGPALTDLQQGRLDIPLCLGV